MSPEQIADNKDYLARAVEASIHIGLVAVLLGACLVILRPFLALITWGVIVSISVYPGYRKLQRALGQRDGLAAVICTLLMLAILIVPLVLLGGTLVDSMQTLIASIKEGKLTIPPPPQSVGTWPIIGSPITSIWSLAATNLTAALDRFMPQIKAIVPLLVSASADLGLTALQFVLSILVAGVLLAKPKAGTAAASSLFSRLFGNKVRVRGADGVYDSKCDHRHSRRGSYPVVLRDLGFCVRGLAGCGSVGDCVSHCRCAATGGPGSCPCSNLHVCRGEYDQSGDLSGLVRGGCANGQCTEADVAGAGCDGSSRSHFLRRNRRIRGNGAYRLVHWCDRCFGGLQTVSRLVGEWGRRRSADVGTKLIVVSARDGNNNG